MPEVRDLAGRLAALGRLDVLINNAGLVLGERRTSADGFEYTFALNHLAPFLLTNLLREQLVSQRARAGHHRLVRGAPRRPARSG